MYLHQDIPANHCMYEDIPLNNSQIVNRYEKKYTNTTIYTGTNTN
jgi:hypothetical protein